jgi:uncharacterized protein YbjT (DUF2867 family)
MRVLLTGATGMVGQGVLRECLAGPDVQRIVILGRTPLGIRDPKVEEIVRSDLYDLSPIESRLENIDACFFCLGVSSSAMSEADYSRVSYDLTMSIAQTLARLNPQMTFIYVSGAGTDSTEKGRTMWARVKGRTENALLRLPIKAAYMFRPALIEPMHGIKSKTKAYRLFYVIARPFWPILRRMPKYVTSTEQIGRAMLVAAKSGAPKQILESDDINRL